MVERLSAGGGAVEAAVDALCCRPVWPHGVSHAAESSPSSSCMWWSESSGTTKALNHYAL